MAYGMTKQQHYRSARQQRILNALSRRDDREALRLAAQFQHLGEHADVIMRGWNACTRPEFYRQLGKDPAQLVAIGVAAVRARYGG